MMKHTGLFLLIVNLWCACPAAAQTCTGSGTRPITVEICSATHDPGEAQVTVFPNPAADVLTVQNDGPIVDFELMDWLGEKKLAVKLAAGSVTRLDIAMLPAGIYLAVWRSGSSGRMWVRKVKIV